VLAASRVVDSLEQVLPEPSRSPVEKGLPPSVPQTPCDDARAQEDRVLKLGNAPFHLRLISAKDLPKVDITTGLCDPYVKLSLGSILHKSTVKHKNRNPVWNEEYFFSFLDSDDAPSKLHIEVWDWNQVVQHSLIGSAVVDLEEIVLDAKGRSEQTWVPLELKVHGKTRVSSFVCVQFKSEDAEETSNSRDCKIPDSPSSKLPEGWKEYWSRSKNKPYYKNKHTGQTCWHLPVE